MSVTSALPPESSVLVLPFASMVSRPARKVPPGGAGVSSQGGAGAWLWARELAGWAWGSGWELWDTAWGVRGQHRRRRAGGMGGLGERRGWQVVQVTGTVLGWHRSLAAASAAATPRTPGSPAALACPQPPEQVPIAPSWAMGTPRPPGCPRRGGGRWNPPGDADLGSRLGFSP